VTGRVEGARLLARLDQLAEAGRDPLGGGITRLAWSTEMGQAVSLVSGWAGEAGAEARLDGAGNLIVTLAGSEAGLAPLVTGSHLDTVIGAGHLDGAYGVVAGIEVLASLADTGRRLRHPLRVVAYANEEGVTAPPFTGSRAIAGAFDPAELAWVGSDGLTLYERLERAGCDPAGPSGSRWDERVAAVVELHVEQGPVLDAAGVAVGVVTAITGQRRGTIEVTGAANHAGTTPMGQRRDALAAAARVILAIEDIALSDSAEVATAGRIEVSPNVANVIAGRATVTFDIRSVDEGRADKAMVILARRADEVAAETGTTITVHSLPPTEAVTTDVSLRAVIAGVARRLGLDMLMMASGAGHDTAIMARLGPAAMIFVPSRNGVSHHPSEWTDPDQLVAGADVLYGSLAAFDEEIDA
jgi:hydantoinase/carbamoylase family amidase